MVLELDSTLEEKRIDESNCIDDIEAEVEDEETIVGMERDALLEFEEEE